MSLPAIFNMFFGSRWNALEVALGVDRTRKHDIHFLDDVLQGEVTDVLIGVGILAQRTLLRLRKKVSSYCKINLKV